MNKLQSNSMSHKFNDNINGVNVVSKLSDANNIMMFLNFIHQNDKKNIQNKITFEKDKLNTVFEEALDRYPVVENTVIDNYDNIDLDLTTIYDTPDEIFYEKTEPKLKTITNIMYSKHKLDQLIKKKNW
jgi:threonine aldolase